jgi:mannitol-specific phosphotransferase system IIBC component
MKKTFALALILLSVLSCNNKKEEQHQQDRETINHLNDENQKLKEEEEQRKKTDIIKNINQYLITTPNAEVSGLGGVSNGSVSIQNRLEGITFQKVVVEVKIIKDNKDVYRTEVITFKNVEPGAIFPVS